MSRGINYLWVIFFLPVLSDAQPEIEADWIRLSDGVQLAVDWYRPAIIPKEGLPVILEYLPYRKEEGRRNRYSLFSYFTNHDYLVARVDIRGTGNSEGRLIEYEYSDQEQLDALEVIDWLSSNAYTNGQVFMMGISWGGFNSLQIAMRKPPALKGIITMMSTDDLYEDDVHYMDGVMHIDAYEIGQDLTNCLPGAPDFIIDSTYFANRFDTKPWLLTYKKQQRDGNFWNRASVNEDYAAIDVPVLAIGGLYDGYRDFLPRYYEHADVPVTAIMGPWNHTFPNWAEPPPAIEWRDFTVEWMNCVRLENCEHPEKFDKFYIYQRGWHPPGISPDSIPGYWRTDTSWPPKKLTYDTLYLAQNSKLSEDKPDGSISHNLKYKPSVGIEASGSVMWWGDWAPDQAAADQQSLLYRSNPLDSALELTGFPLVRLSTSCDASEAHWVVRLCDEAPDGQVTLVTGAAYNGNHWISAEDPRPLPTNEPVDLKIEMHFTTWTFKKGHRIRLAVCNSQWPMLWPTASSMTMSIHLSPEGLNQIILPIMPGDSSFPTFHLPVPDPKLPDYETIFSETLSGYAEIKESCYDHRLNSAEILATNSSEESYPWGIMKYTEEIKHRTNDLNPSETSVESMYTISALLSGRQLRWEGHLSFSSDAEYFFYRYTRKLFDNQSLVREKSWIETIPRDFH